MIKLREHLPWIVVAVLILAWLVFAAWLIKRTYDEHVWMYGILQRSMQAAQQRQPQQQPQQQPPAEQGPQKPAEQ
jgi:hypothetical protein